MKKIIFFITLFSTPYLFSQVGINTSNPKGIFNVDGGKDNPSTGSSHTADQQLNDFIITETGNVGVGTIFPASKMHIVSKKGNGGLQLQDGTEGVGKILVSDKDGKASWINNIAITPTVIGTVNKISKTVVSNTYTNASITLNSGKWLINIGQITRSSEISSENFNLWIRLTLSSSNTKIESNGFSFIGTKYVSGWSSNLKTTEAEGGYSFLQGVIPVEITSDTPLTLSLWFENCTKGSNGAPKVTIGANGENYLFATPMN